MADPNIKISITADDKASGKLKNLDDQVGKTGSGMSNLGKAAAAGGVALVALGVKSVMAFEDLGLTVGKFADATGLSAEAASRLIEVGDDIGISSETLSSSIGKMSKQLGANAEAFKAYGIEVVKGKDGQTDVNETFLHAIDVINQIQDPLKKAEASAKVFGKGYQQMSELLGQSSDKIRTNLAAVSDQKVFDDKKVQDARDMREAFDSIVDAGQDLILTIGKALAPVITKLAPILVKVVEAAAPVAEALGDVLVSALETVGPIIEDLLPVIQALAKGLSLVAKAISVINPTEEGKAFKQYLSDLEALKVKALEAGMSLDEFNAMVDASTEASAQGATAADHWGAITGTLAGRLDEATASTSETDRETRKLAAGMEVAKDTTDAEAEAVAKFELAEKNLRDAIADGIQAQRDMNQARKDALGNIGDLDQSLRDLASGYWDLQQQQLENIKTQDDHTLSQGEKEQSNRDLLTSEHDLAEKVAETAAKYAEENGAVEGTKRQTDLMRDSLEMSKAQYPALAAEIQKYIDKLLNIPTDVTTRIHAPIGGGLAYEATGTTNAPDAFIAGEKGPELVVGMGGATVYTAGQTAAMGGAGGGGPMVINITMPVGTNGNDVVRAIKEFERRNGPGWRT